MAESRVTQTGVDELRALYRAAPARVNAIALRVARGAGNAMAVDARRRLQSPTPATKAERHSVGATAALIEVEEDPANKRVLVHSPSPARYPANLVLWREHGTIRQLARPYMQPAAVGQAARYDADFQTAMAQLAQELSS